MMRILLEKLAQDALYLILGGSASGSGLLFTGSAGVFKSASLLPPRLANSKMTDLKSLVY